MPHLRTLRRAPAILALGALLLPTACVTSRRSALDQPTVVLAPYDRSGGEPLVAVVPLANESGTTLADPEAISDQLVAALAEVDGVRCLPLNRTLAAMAALDMPVVASPGDARRLAQAMNVDGLVVGSLTAYDPYNPPVIGLNLALYARGESMAEPDGPRLDTRSLTASATDPGLGASAFREHPVATVAEHLDAKNHGVLASVQDYARGRHDPDSPLGWRRYVSSMPLFSEFAAHHAVAGLMHAETARVAPSAIATAGDEGREPTAGIARGE